MNKLKYVAFALVGLLLASCMGEDYAPAEYSETPFGNNSIQETNVITIAQLKSQFSNFIQTDYRNGVSYTQIKDDIKIKGVVTSSDEQGNIYNELAIEDETGAIIAAVAQSGLYGSLPIGTEILVDLKDLYIGNYGLQPEIGVPTQNANGATYVGRMGRALWGQHYRILSTGNTVEPKEFNKNTWDLAKDGGRLGVIRNVSFKSNNGGVDSTYANAGGGAGSVSWTLNEESNNIIVYNSNYADFANAKIPEGKVDITGIFKRFNNQWEIIIRSLDDVQPAGSTNPSAGLAGTGEGTLESPFDVTRALSLIASGKADATEYYISGIISQVDDVDTGQYGNATYYISTDGKTDTQLMVYRGYYLNGDKFTAETKPMLAVGKKVVILGKLKDYNGTPEVDSRSKIISIQ